MGVINKTTSEINTLLDKVENMPEEGVTGKTPVLETGSTTTLEPGQNATSQVVANGTDSSGNPKYKINFGIPRGYDGSSTGGGGVADSVQWSNVLNKPTWVNSSTKPTYTATEVGALPVATIIPSKTSQLTNDVGYVTSSTLKTINGQSIVGEGNIEISGTGVGIADAPSDGKTYGRKDGNWSAIEGCAGSVDISDIVKRIIQLSEIGGTCTDEDYNTLKGYADNGTVVYCNYDGTSTIFELLQNDSYIQIYYNSPDDGIYSNIVFSIDTSKKVSSFVNYFYSSGHIGEGTLGSYSKPSSYSVITKDDSISTAIGKLEAGIGNTNSSSNGVYYLSGSILNLTSESTNDEVLNAFGGIEKLNEFVTEVGINGKQSCIYSKMAQIMSGTGYNIPVSCRFIGFAVTSLYLNFIHSDNNKNNVETTIYVTYSSGSSTITSSRVIKTYLDGYGVNPSFYSITSSSSNEDISSALGGESGFKELIQAIIDGNRIYIKSSTDVQQRTDLLCNTYSKSENGDMSVMFFGFGYALWGQFGGYMTINYSKASNTFSATVGAIN